MSETAAIPSADIFAHAIVEACRMTGDDPISCATGEYGVRARYYAFAALNHLFPNVAFAVLGRCVGSKTHGTTLLAAVKARRREKDGWWDEEAYCDLCCAIMCGGHTTAKTEKWSPEISTREYRKAKAARAIAASAIELNPSPLSEETNPVATVGILVPSWVPPALQAKYLEVATKDGEEFAASCVRALKRQPKTSSFLRSASYEPAPWNDGDPPPGRSALDQRKGAP